MADIGVIDDAAAPLAISVAATAKTIPESGNRLVGRRSIVIQATDGDIYWAYGTGVTLTTGFLLRQEALLQIEASEQVHVSIIAATGTVNVRTQELG